MIYNIKTAQCFEKNSTGALYSVVAKMIYINAVVVEMFLGLGLIRKAVSFQPDEAIIGFLSTLELNTSRFVYRIFSLTMDFLKI